MLQLLAKKIFGSANDRIIKKLQPTVSAINELEPEIEALSDKALKNKTEEFRERLKNGETLDDILVEAFAIVREAAKRTLGQRPYDVQLMGGIILHRGQIAEMKTGEGKTLVATLPSYLNAIEGKGVHVVTVNDYLAERDAAWMAKVYNFLGLTVGCITNNVSDEARKAAYEADITYGTNNEYGFDYLRDNMKFDLEDRVQRDFNFAIVDEVDSILIDEARTPLIISGPVDDNSELYISINKYIPKLKEDDFEVDEKHKNISLTEDGTHNIEEILLKGGVLEKDTTLYDAENISIVHHVNQALKAHKLFVKDKDYIVKDDKVIIIDEFTGRMMEGRRYSDGLHQALEAKEGVSIQRENQTLASVTFQNYFRLYPKLSGMTGTALTEATEFSDIYTLEVVEIPTHVPITRIDDDDAIYRTSEEKYDAIISLIREANKNKQPVLVGTVSIDKSEELSKVLKKNKVAHNVLNARHHEKEATIIAQAGQPGTVTIATNMAGRGTDIQLGGNAEMLIQDKVGSSKDEKKIKDITKKITEQVKKDHEIVKEAGGLMVIGTERHESRRIDNQLRGRSGRQGDPGFTKFFLSLEDDLMRIFGADKRMDYVMRTLGEEGEPITHPLLTRTLEKAQRKVEGMHYEVRKNLLKYDDVMNDQRKVIFEQRLDIMEAEDASELIDEMHQELVDQLVSQHIPANGYIDTWDLDGLSMECRRVFGVDLPLKKWANEEGVAEDIIADRIADETAKIFTQKEEQYGKEIMRDAEKRILLFTLDELWKEHLHALDHLRQGIGLRAYGQKDPLNEYKREAFMLFQGMLASLRENVVQRLSHIAIHTDAEELDALRRKTTGMKESRVDPNMAGPAPAEAVQTFEYSKDVEFDPNNPDTWGKVGRNSECPCGSGKKYKHCHGKI